jgi:hypothetical protein
MCTVQALAQLATSAVGTNKLFQIHRVRPLGTSSPKTRRLFIKSTKLQ